MEEIMDFCHSTTIKPSVINSALEKLGTTPLREGTKIDELLSRPQLNMDTLASLLPQLNEKLNGLTERKEEITEATEIKIKYKGYIERERVIAEKMHRLENIKIRDRFDYESLQQLSTEARQKLKAINPDTLAQASRIPGVSPSDINVLLVLLGR